MPVETISASRSVSSANDPDKETVLPVCFRPLPLLGNAHAQTIVAMFWPSGREDFPSSHQLVELSDGDKLVVVISTPPAWRPNQRTVVLVHGLCGCHGSPYMVRMASKLVRLGLRAVRVNLRGCGSGVGLARQPYHSGRSEDVRAVLNWLARLAPESPVTLVGFSLGGNIVIKMAGEDGDHPAGRLDRLIGVSAPIDLNACSRLIEQPGNRVYDWYFVRRLLADVRERQRFFPDLPPLQLPPRLTLRMFDDLYTAPRSGFRDAMDYYTQSSSAPLIERIAVRTLLLSSRDDPFIAATSFENVPSRPHIEVRLIDNGGHLGFVGFTGKPMNFRWMDQTLLDWIAQ